MQSADLGGVLLFSDRRQSSRLVRRAINAAGTGRSGTYNETVGGVREMAGRETEDEDEDKLGYKQVCLCCLDL